MSLQKTILKQYMDLSDSPTLKAVSAETGIQITRVFRLLNGSAMKLSEYMIFQDLIRKKLEVESDIEEIFQICLEKLPLEELKEVETIMRRKLNFYNLFENHDEQQEAVH